MELIKANKRLFDAIVALHPELCMGVKEEEELYLAMHLAKEATNNHKEQVNVTLGSVSNSLTINEVAAKYGEKVKCMFYDYDDNWKESERVVNSSFLKDMEQGAIKNCC